MSTVNWIANIRECKSTKVEDGMTVGRIFLLAAVLFSFALPSVAREWPQRPVRTVVPFPPGSSVDIIARVLAASLGKRVDQPFIAVNHPAPVARSA